MTTNNYYERMNFVPGKHYELTLRIGTTLRVACISLGEYNTVWFKALKGKKTYQLYPHDDLEGHKLI